MKKLQYRYVQTGRLAGSLTQHFLTTAVSASGTSKSSSGRVPVATTLATDAIK